LCQQDTQCLIIHQSLGQLLIHLHMLTLDSLMLWGHTVTCSTHHHLRQSQESHVIHGGTILMGSSLLDTLPDLSWLIHLLWETATCHLSGIRTFGENIPFGPYKGDLQPSRNWKFYKKMKGLKYSPWSLIVKYYFNISVHNVNIGKSCLSTTHWNWKWKLKNRRTK
jgi:hypothetical protein